MKLARLMKMSERESETLARSPEASFLFELPGASLHRATAEEWFHKGVLRAGLEHLVAKEVGACGGHPQVIMHDLRRSFCNHAAVAGWSFQKLRDSMGQVHAASVQAYLDEADGHVQSESIFCHPTARSRHAQKRREAAIRGEGAVLRTEPTAFESPIQAVLQ